MGIKSHQEMWHRAYLAQQFANAQLSKELKDPVLWMESIWTLRGDPTKPYRLDGYEYLREILLSQHPMGVVMAGAGVGKTEAFLPWSLAHADFGEVVLYCFETDRKTGLLVQERVNPNFRSNPYLKSRVQGEADSIQIKKLRSGLVYFMGLGTDSATRSFHGNKLVLDEYDAMDQGRTVDMEKRLASSGSPIIRKISNPSSPEFGIHQEYLRGDQRRWHLKCPSCKEVNPLEWSSHVEQETLTVRCPDCGKPMDRRGPGFWKATNPDGAFPSWHIHRLMAPACDLARMRDELNSDEERVKSAAWRMDLGLPYAEREGGLNDADLHGAAEGNLWSEFAPGGFVVCDPGGKFDCQLWSAPRHDGSSLCVWSGTVKGFAGLESLADAAKVSGGLVDYGPEITEAEAFCKRQASKGQWWRRVAYKLSEAPGIPAWLPDSIDPLLIAANRTAVIDEMVSGLRHRKLLFPARMVNNPQGRFAQHMKSPRRVLEHDSHGVPRVRWVHESTSPDHQFHCTTYAWIYLSSHAKRRGAGIQGEQRGW